MNAKTKAAIIRHGEQLLKLFKHATERDPVRLCSKLRKLEREGAALGLRLCNGPEFSDEAEPDRISGEILDKVDTLLSFRRSQVQVIVNRDPRGYALKIRSEWMSKHPNSKLHRDFGGYGIIAPT